MNIPEKIRIAGIDYSIVFVPRLSDDGKVFSGQIKYAPSTIELNGEDKYKHQYNCVTIWHEVLHALATHACLDLGKDSEKIVDVFAFGLNQVLEDNKETLFNKEV